MKKSMFLTAAALAGIASAQTTAPQDKPVLTLSQFLVKEVRGEDGKMKETFVAAPKSVTPGSILEQRIVVSYKGTKAAKLRGLRLPVPKGTSFVSVGKSAVTVEYSLDGKAFALSPLKTITVDGKAKQVPAELSDYRMIRWNLSEIAPGETKTFTARFKVQ